MSYFRPVDVTVLAITTNCKRSKRRITVEQIYKNVFRFILHAIYEKRKKNQTKGNKTGRVLDHFCFQKSYSSPLYVMTKMGHDENTH